MGSLADETRWLDATDQATLVRNGDVTPLELLDAAIERAERINPLINALTWTWFDRARDEAEARRKACGPRSRLPPVLHADLPTQRTGGGDAHPRATCPSHRSPTGPPRCHAYPMGLAGAAPPVLG